MIVEFKDTSFLVGTVSSEILADTENQSKRLINKYNNADSAEREAIDSVLLCLCGWTFKTLHQKAIEAEAADHYCELSNAVFYLEKNWVRYHQSDEVCHALDVMKWYNEEMEEGTILSNLEKTYGSVIDGLKNAKSSIIPIKKRIESEK